MDGIGETTIFYVMMWSNPTETTKINGCSGKTYFTLEESCRLDENPTSFLWSLLDFQVTTETSSADVFLSRGHFLHFACFGWHK